MEVSQSSKTKKTVIGALAGTVAVATLLAGSMAFFTDRDSADANATAGNIDLVFTDKSTGTEGSNNEFAVAKSWDNSIVSEGKIINPGDYFDLSYELTNDGSKSIDIDQRIVLTSDVEMDKDAAEYALTITGGNDSEAIVPVISQDGLTAVYDFEPITINGSVEEEDENVSGAYDVQLDFAKEAKNAFMDSNVEIELQAQAKQHRNTEASDFSTDWETLASVEKVN